MKIGTDIVSCERIKKVFSSESRKEKCFTQYEIAYCENKGEHTFQSYAGLFAAKEAVAKAFGFGIGGVVSFLTIEIVHNELGAPFVRLIGNASKHFISQRFSDIQISISHCNEYATAVCVIV